MSPDLKTLSGRIDRLYDLQISLFDVTRILFGFVIDKGVLTAEEATKRLQDHIDEVPPDRRDSDKTMALRLLLEIARAQRPPHRPRPPGRGRPQLRVVDASRKSPHRPSCAEKP